MGGNEFDQPYRLVFGRLGRWASSGPAPERCIPCGSIGEEQVAPAFLAAISATSFIVLSSSAFKFFASFGRVTKSSGHGFKKKTEV